MAHMAERLKQTAEQALKTITKDSALDVEKFFDKYLSNELHRKAIYGERSFTFPQDLSDAVKDHLGSVVESPTIGTYFEFSFDTMWDYTFILFRHLENKLKGEGFQVIWNAENTPYIKIMW